MRRRRTLVAALVGYLAVVSPALAVNTYYVNPGGSCNDANQGTSAGAPWCTLPGSRKADNTGFLRTQWGSINGTTTKVQCGDTILIKGGSAVDTATTYSTDSTPGAGSLCLANTNPTFVSCACDAPIPCTSGQVKLFYATGCNYLSGGFLNDVDIKIATDAEWDAGCLAGTGLCGHSLGDFSIDCAGMIPHGLYFTNGGPSGGSSDGCVDLHVDGLRFRGNNANQRIEIKNVTAASGAQYGIQAAGGGLSNVEIGWVNVHDICTSAGSCAGIGVASVNNVVVHDSELHDNGGPGYDCGLQNNNNCNGSALVDSLLYNNGGSINSAACIANPNNCGFFNDAVYLQGGFNFFTVFRNVIRDNFTAGANSGNAAHIYDVQNVGYFERNTFVHNGRADISSSAQANTQGGGDGYPDESGAPATGYCNSVSGGSDDPDGEICSTSTSGTCLCSKFDSYSVYKRNVFMGALRPNTYVHHGSGFTIYLGNTLWNGALRGTGQFEDHERAADHTMANEIIVGVGPTIAKNQDSIGPTCRQGCPNAGKPCGGGSGSPALCQPCSNTPVAACGPYLPMMTVTHSLLRPATADSQQLSVFNFVCNSDCTGGTANQPCASDSDCQACASGCTWRNTGVTYAQALANPHQWIKDGVGNLIGIAQDPKFVNVSAPTCIDGTTYSACDFRLQSNSPGLHTGTYAMLTNGSGSNSTQLEVNQNPKLASRGVLNFNGRLWKPTTFFRGPNAWPNYVGSPQIASTIQIAGATCADVAPKLGSDPATPDILDGTYNAERAIVAGLADTRCNGTAGPPGCITLDRPCSWGGSVGVSDPWTGSGPNMGAFPDDLGTTPTTTSTSTTNTTTSFTTSTSVAPPATSSTSTSTSSTSSTLPGTLNLNCDGCAVDGAVVNHP